MLSYTEYRVLKILTCLIIERDNGQKFTNILLKDYNSFDFKVRFEERIKPLNKSQYKIKAAVNRLNRLNYIECNNLIS